MTRECRVLVLGGGSAGLAAAVCAARAGAETVLLERGGMLGGAGTLSLVHTFCGLFRLAEPGNAPELANPGFAAEMAERMERATGAGPVRMGRVWVLPQDPREFARIAGDVAAGEGNLEVLLGAEAFEARRDGGAWNVGFACAGRRGWIRAQAVVDATGDAAFAAMPGRMAGGGSEPRATDGEARMTLPRGGAVLQRPAYVAGVAGVTGEMDGNGRLRLAQRVVAGVGEGRLGPEALGTAFRSGAHPGTVFLTVDLDADGERYDPLDPGCVAELGRIGRRTVREILGWLREKEAGWGEARIEEWPERIGVRESRRWRGRHVLRAAEWRSGARFGDDAALATWPMEFRRDARGPKFVFPENGAPCGIPLRCLQTAGAEGVWCAGRCISVDDDVQASVRVMGTCFATGEAAGRAAAE